MKHRRKPLDLRAPGAIDDLIAFHRQTFGGWRMEADDKKDDAGKKPPADDKKDDGDDGFKSDHSKRAVLEDLARERDARQALEAEMSNLKKSIAEAFGVKSNDKDKDADVLATVQQQLATMQRENVVLALANRNGITDEKDLALLKSSALEGDDLAAMAERLKPAETASGTPKPDKTQGAKGEPTKREALPGVPRMAQAFEDALNTN